MPDNIWDDPRLARGEYVKFVKIGDGIAGTIVALGFHKWEDGTEDPKLTILEEGETEPRILTVGQVQLQSLLAAEDCRPSVGDRITIKFTGIEPRPGGKTKKLFEVSKLPAAAAPAGVPATSLLGG